MPHLFKHSKARLAELLDGMALAIELAAARFATLGLDGLESGLDQRLRLLTAGPRVVDRHGSLRAAIDWSYDLLSSADRGLLRGVAVFASWFDVDAGRAVAGASRERTEIADGLARLAEHSLLVVERGEPTRYRALETIRQYGVERLHEAGELDQIRAGHERWCREALGSLRRTAPADIDDAWCARFDRIVDDAGAALAWSAGEGGRRAQAAALAAELAGLLFLRGRQAQAQRRYEQGAELATTVTERTAQLRLAAGAAASRFVGDDALRLFRMAADAAASAGDRAGAARDLATMAMYINRAPGIMATPHSRAEAEALVAEARALSDGSPLALAAIAVATAWVARPTLGDARRAVEVAERAGDGIGHSIALDLLTLANLISNDFAGAVRIAGRRLEVLDTLAVGPLSGFEFGDGRAESGSGDLRRCDMRGDDDRREAWVRLTIDLGVGPEQLTGCLLGWPPVFDGLLALHRNDAAAAVRLLAADIDTPELFHYLGAGPWRPWYAALWAEAAVLDHRDDAAARIERSRHAARGNPIATAMVERAAAMATGDRDALVRLAVTFARLGCPYQQARTGRLAAGPPAPGSG